MLTGGLNTHHQYLYFKRLRIECICLNVFVAVDLEFPVGLIPVARKACIRVELGNDCCRAG
jgi:hypothetical protein